MLIVRSNLEAANNKAGAILTSNRAYLKSDARKRQMKVYKGINSAFSDHSESVRKCF